MPSFREIYGARINQLTAGDSIRMLDAMKGYFADGSRHGKGAYGVMGPQKCLVGCLMYLRAQKGAQVDMAHKLIMKAIREQHPSVCSIEQFNDSPFVTYADIVAVIQRAKELAMPVTITPPAQRRTIAPPVPPAIEAEKVPSPPAFDWHNIDGWLASHISENVFSPEIEKVDG